MPRSNQLSPQDQYPIQAIDESVQIQQKPDDSLGPGYPGTTGYPGYLTLMLASVADNMPPWGVNVTYRDEELRHLLYRRS